MSYKKELTVKKIFPVQTIPTSNGDFVKQEFVAGDVDARYPKDILLEASGKAMPYMENIAEGDVVEVEFDLETRPTKDGKYFGNRAKAFKIFKIGSHSEGSSGSYSQAAEEGSNDLPF